MQGCALEWRTNFQREATTEDSKRGQSRNTLIRDPRILCTPLSKFLDPPLHADSEDSDQIGWMSRLIWVFARRTAILLVLSCRGSCPVGAVFRRRQSIVLYSRQSSAKRLKVVCGDTLAPMSFTYGRNSNEPSKVLLSSGQLIKDWCAQSWIMAVRLGTPQV